MTDRPVGVMQNILDGGPLEAAETGAVIGFEGLEVNVGSHDDPLLDDPGFREELRGLAGEGEIELPSLCLGVLNGGNVSSEDADVREAARDAIERGLHAAADLGAGAVLCPFFGSAEMETAADRERAAEGLSPMADVAAGAGVTLAVESTLSAAHHRDLLEAIDGPAEALGVYYDVGNAISYGEDPVAGLRELDDLVARVHFKDRAGDESVALGEGEVDFDGVCEALDDISYESWIVLETAGGDDRAAEAERNLRLAREILGRN
jgi:sugar phosphate isomerase/epimerase